MCAFSKKCKNEKNFEQSNCKKKLLDGKFQDQKIKKFNQRELSFKKYNNWQEKKIVNKKIIDLYFIYDLFRINTLIIIFKNLSWIKLSVNELFVFKQL